MNPHFIKLPYGWLQNLQTVPKLVLLSTLLFLSLTLISLCNTKSFLHLYQYVPPNPSYFPSPSTSSSSDGSPASNPTSKSVTVDKECNVSRGEWVTDPNAPYYTNMTCWAIQEHQNCMKYGRPDMEFLKWRWKPEGCELLRFDPVRFLELVRGKSMAFVGDSLARNQMQSLMCLLSKVEYPKDISYTTDEDFKRMFYPTYNFTIWIFWSPFLVKVDKPNKNTSLYNLYLDEVDDTWSSEIDQFDYVIISGGNWFSRPTMFYEKKKVIGCNFCQVNNVTELTLRYSHRMAFRTAFKAINHCTKFKGMVLLRTMSPKHFENGEWNNGGNCVRTKPFRGNEVRLEEQEDFEFYRVQLEEFRYAKAERGLDFRLLDTTRAMLLRPDGHPSRYGHWANANVTLYNDCVHWCLPGPVDVWNDFLLHVLSF